MTYQSKIEELNDLSISKISDEKNESTNLIITTDQLNKSIKDDNELVKNNQSKTDLMDKDSIFKNWIKLSFILDWNDNSQLINLLNEFINFILIGCQTINPDENKDLIEKTDSLIKMLTNLPLKLNESKNVKLITSDLRDKIINQLIKNKYLIFYKHLIKNDVEDQFIEQNRDLIFELLHLPTEIISDNDYNNDDNYKDYKKTDKSINKRKFEDTYLDDYEEENNKKLKTEITDDQYVKLESDDDKSITFNCILTDAKKFFNQNNEYYSESFSFLNLEFQIYIRSIYSNKDNKRYLSFFLKLISELDDDINIKLKTYYELRLKNKLPYRFDKMVKYNYTFFKSESIGCSKFISTYDLFDLDNKFVDDNNCVNLEVYLKQKN